MPRSFLVALAAVLGLGAAGIVVLLVVTREGPAPRSAPEPVHVPPPPPEAATPQPLPQPAPGPPRPAVPVASVKAQPQAPAPTPPPAESWEAVDPAGRPAELGAIGPGVMAGLNGLAGKIAGCFDPDAEARFAGSGAAPTLARDSTTLAGTGTPPVLLLQLETQAGSVRVVDAPVESYGSAGEGVVLCAQSALRGLVLTVPAARAGERHRLRYALVP